MQFQFWSAVLLFLGSYLPLAVILMVQDIATKYRRAPLCGWRGQWNCQFQILAHPWLAWGTVVVTFGALLLMVVALRSVRLPHRVHVQEVKAIPNDLINYVLPYVVSFMGLSYADPQKLGGFLVFWVVLFLITYRSGQILMNPLLIVLGWKLYEAKVGLGQSGAIRMVRVLKKGPLVPSIQMAEEIQDVYLMRDP
ncbi:hypothetical protein [Xanthomonas campestris]|uniref:Uncharacterized protein n=1 Tax=Xanthomonas campestris pv. papavericola TaxID=487881 RepID=A0AAJ2X5Q9_XANCA|nr:hypothetical protein [Xanthomonas campestris]MEC3889255.1 hypothetical protein [Xanthomonas campestris pv. papavericola]